MDLILLRRKLNEPLIQIGQVCVVDEAGQISQPICLAPLLRCERFVLVGDPHQLRPLVRSKLAKVEFKADVSLFERLARAHGGTALRALSTQYRMNESIMELCNAALEGEFELASSQQAAAQGDGDAVWSVPRKLACGNADVATHTLRLAPSPSQQQQQQQQQHRHHREDAAQARHHRAPTWLREAVRLDASFVDVPRALALASRATQTRNGAECAVVHAVVTELLARGCEPGCIAVLSPFRAQLKLLSETLRASCEMRDAWRQHPNLLEFSTIDRFQGRDAQCVIISLVRSQANAQAGRNDAYIHALTAFFVFLVFWVCVWQGSGKCCKISLNSFSSSTLAWARVRGDFLFFSFLFFLSSKRDTRTRSTLLAYVYVRSPIGELLGDARRLNVALSRAKAKLVLVGCAEVLEAGSAVFRRLLAVARQRAALVVVDAAPAAPRAAPDANKPPPPLSKATAPRPHAGRPNAAFAPTRAQTPVLCDIIADLT